MSSTTDLATPTTASLGAIGSAALRSIKTRPFSFVVHLLVCSAIVFSLNVYVAVVLADGIGKTSGAFPFVWPPNAWATGQPFPYQPFFFWTLTGFMISVVLGHWRSGGTKALIDALFGIPERLREIFHSANVRPLAFFLWGIAAGLYFFGRLHVWFVILLSVVSLYAAVSHFGRALGNVFRAQPATPEASSMFSAFLVGIAAAGVIMAPFANLTLMFKLALLFGVIAWSSARHRRGGTGVVPLAGLMVVVSLVMFFPELALAHDGGLAEGGGTIDGVIQSPAMKEVLKSGSFASVMGAAGGAVGSPVGSAMSAGAWA